MGGSAVLGGRQAHTLCHYVVSGRKVKRPVKLLYAGAPWCRRRGKHMPAPCRCELRLTVRARADGRRTRGCGWAGPKKLLLSRRWRESFRMIGNDASPHGECRAFAPGRVRRWSAVAALPTVFAAYFAVSISLEQPTAGPLVSPHTDLKRGYGSDRSGAPGTGVSTSERRLQRKAWGMLDPFCVLGSVVWALILIGMAVDRSRLCRVDRGP